MIVLQTPTDAAETSQCIVSSLRRSVFVIIRVISDVAESFLWEGVRLVWRVAIALLTVT